MVLAVTTTLEVAGLPPVRLREERDNEDVPRTGCRVWSCARLLSAWLASACRRQLGGGADGADDADAGRGRSFAPRVAGRDVLELGAGTGAVGLVCALLGARSVTMTDRDEATLALVHANARLNGHATRTRRAGVRASARLGRPRHLPRPRLRPHRRGGCSLPPGALRRPPRGRRRAPRPRRPARRRVRIAPAGLMEPRRRHPAAADRRHRDALVLRDDDPRDAAAITAAEHAHDGAQSPPRGDTCWSRAAPEDGRRRPRASRAAPTTAREKNPNPNPKMHATRWWTRR